MGLAALWQRARQVDRRFRQASMLAKAFRLQYAPVAVHLIPTRRCNLSCQYCNEFDDHSAPVPTAHLVRRVDLLADLGTGILTLSGGEPLLHPDLDTIVAHARRRGMIATIITNGFLLSRERIERLNRAGLDHLQLSIDNVTPDGVSKKSLELLDKRLQWLASQAEFDVTVNAVVGAGTHGPEDALVVARRAKALGFSTTVGILHDHEGRLRPLDGRQRDVVQEVVGIGESTFDFANYNRFQKNVMRGQPNAWQCRAGCRYLYVCEEGLVHWCSQQRGRPGIPLERYGRQDLEREYHRAKPCAPFCTVGCVHRVAQVDDLRTRPVETLDEWFAARGDGTTARLPLPVRILTWTFVTGPARGMFRRAAARLLGAAGAAQGAGVRS
jgi:hypothetical protein